MLPVQCRMARAALGLTVRKLAVAARVASQTIVRFERGEGLRPRTVTSLKRCWKLLAWSSPMGASREFD